MKTPLTSWKEIARYLNKSVRTVQRWEREFGLPVRRPAGRDAATVLALPQELDLWLQRQTVARAVQELQDEMEAVARHPQIAACVERLRASSRLCHVTSSRSTALIQRSQALMEEMRRQVERLTVALENGQALEKRLAAQGIAPRSAPSAAREQRLVS